MACTNAEHGCVQPWEDSEHCRVRPSNVSEPCGWCRNVSATLRVTLDIHPNVAGIGTLHLLATLYSDLRSDVTRRASEGEREGSGGRVHNGGRQKGVLHVGLCRNVQ